MVVQSRNCSIGGAKEYSETFPGFVRLLNDMHHYLSTPKRLNYLRLDFYDIMQEEITWFMYQVYMNNPVMLHIIT